VYSPRKAIDEDHDQGVPATPAAAAAALALSASVLAACGGGASDVAGDTGGAKADTTLTLVAYAVPEPGWSKIIPAFAATPEGKGVAVTTSYGASGDQSARW
jgi:sulfate transport system substrate-binding protein